MTTENIGDIVISPRVLEVITGIATTKVDGVHSLRNKAMTDSFSKTILGKGIYLQIEEGGTVGVGIYVYLQYSVNVPAISVTIQQAVKAVVYDMAEVTISSVNTHAEDTVPEKAPKLDLKALLDEDLLDG